MGIIFPFYAGFFVEWKEGMKIWFVMGCILAGLSIGILNYLVCKAVLLKKLRMISRISSVVRAGDLSQKCVLQSADMIGDIIDGLNMMIGDLKKMVSHIQQSANQLEGDMKGMMHVFSSTQAGMHTQEKQTVSLEQAVTGLKHDAHDIALKATSAKDMADKVKLHTGQTNEIARQTHHSIMALNDNVVKTTDVVKLLDDKSNQISMVTEVIRGIAEQTNLLALNAAIEAARAGEQGRGFAVVADEVRTLATRTQESTSQIEEIIGELQKGADQAVSVMRLTSEDAGSAADNFAKTEERLKDIEQLSDHIAALIEVFMKTAEKQDQSAENVSHQISAIHEVGQSTLQGVDNSVETCQRILSQAQQLKELAGRFKI